MTFARFVALAALFVLVAPAGAAAGWDPQGYASESTLEIRTVEEGAGDHWSPVWLVVFDDELYVRLGNRAASRIDNNMHKPLVSLRVAGEEFETVETEPVPEMADKVAAAMADKYWFDLFVRFLPHPLTLRLAPADSAAPDAPADADGS